MVEEKEKKVIIQNYDLNYQFNLTLNIIKRSRIQLSRYFSLYQRNLSSFLPNEI